MVVIRHLILILFIFICVFYVYEDPQNLHLTNNNNFSEEEEYNIDSNYFDDFKTIKISTPIKDNKTIFSINWLPDAEEILKEGTSAVLKYMRDKKEAYTVKSGDNIIDILDLMNINKESINEIIYRNPNGKKLNNIRVGEKIEFIWKHIEDGLKIRKIRKKINKNKYLIVDFEKKEEVAIYEKEFELEKNIQKVYGSIDNSFYASAIGFGLSPRQINQIVDIFKWKIDLNSKIRKGDFFAIEYEEEVLFNEVVGKGDINAVYLNINNNDYYAIKFSDGNFYDQEGKNLEKAFNRYPVDDPRITSSYSLTRMHPILKIRRPHYGVDFGGYAGKPIKSTGDGRVIFSGRNGGYGLMVKIEHNNGYETYYAHLSKLKAKRFQKVKRGEIIGYMGNTGASTGTHLHYELKINNRAVNPMKIDIPTKESVSNMEEFNKVLNKFKVDFQVIMEKEKTE